VNLEGQIELIAVPQEFTRLCNSVLSADFGQDFLPIDDDRADGGNDGFLKSKKKVFAVHCFKRLQKQRITDEIRRKMLGDLGKALMLKEQGLWDIAAWTYISNYAIPEEIGREVVSAGHKHGIEISWLGPTFLANGLQRNPDVWALFPTLQTNNISEQLQALRDSLEEPEPKPSDRVLRTGAELHAVRTAQPKGWEYLLFAGHLFLGKENLELKWRDHELPPYVDRRTLGDVGDATAYLSGAFDKVTELVEALMGVFPEEIQEQAFGAPGEPGDPVRIEHFAARIIQTYGELLDWAASLRAIDPPEVLLPSFESATQMADQPLGELREFFDATVREFDRIPAYLNDRAEGDPPLQIDLALKLTVDDEVSAEFHRRLRRARRKIRLGI
jgi:hypothetical protein